jgi:hypothetical protein
MITANELQQLLNTRPSKPIRPLSALLRAAYWREYHQHRQATDATYRARKIKAALKSKANKAALENQAKP